MRVRIPLALPGLVLAAALATPLHAAISVGQPANPFTKNQLSGSGIGTPVSLSDYHGQVKILFLLGYN